MNDEITVTLPGGVRVDTVRIGHRAASFRELANGCRELLARLAVADMLGNPMLLWAGQAPGSAYRAEEAIDEAKQRLLQASVLADGLAAALALAAVGYELADRAADDAAEHVAARIAWLLGAASRTVLPLALPGLVVAAGGAAAAWTIGGAIVGEENRDEGWRRLLAENPWLTSNSTLAGVIGLATKSLDDFAMGVIGVPPELAAELGNDDLGLLNSQTSAAVLAGLGSRIGLFGESPVTVTRTGSSRIYRGPTDLPGLIDRIPAAREEGDPQIRIERFTHADGPDTFVVYIAGTAEWDPRGTDTPFDLTSNVTGLAGANSGSERAVRDAMRQAGITANSPVVFSGHSQGGLVAHVLAASGDFNTVAVLEVGAPAVQETMPTSAPVIRLVHPQDIVTAAGGDSRVTDVSHDPWRNAPMGESDFPVLAHDRQYYRDSAEAMEASDEPSILALKAAVRDVTGGATTVTASTFVAKRSKREKE
jgi:hypothetical protein